jgi:hypothetical protein
MRRYVTIARRPRAGVHWDDVGALGAATEIAVIDREDTPQPTGLYDRHGNELYSVSNREPVGFVRLREAE